MISATDLRQSRMDLGVTQSDLALAMGLPLRTLQDIEGARNPMRPVHFYAWKSAMLRLCVEKGRIDMLPEDVKADALAVVRMLEAPKGSAFQQVVR